MIGKRHLKRLVKKQKSEINKRIAENPRKNMCCVLMEDENSENARRVAASGSDSVNSENRIVELKPKTLESKLKDWFQECTPSFRCCASLLNILKSENLNVPLSVRSLLDHPEKCVVRTVSPGQYIHIGVKIQLEKLANEILQENPTAVNLDIGIDGLPLFKSSQVALWPILGRVANIRCKTVILIGCYVGKKKPSNIEVYLHDFVEEINVLSVDGISLNDVSYKVVIRAFICDTPARSYICGVKGHNALNGCSKCHQKGKRVQNVTTFSSIPGNPRLDLEFVTR